MESLLRDILSLEECFDDDNRLEAVSESVALVTKQLVDASFRSAVDCKHAVSLCAQVESLLSRLLSCMPGEGGGGDVSEPLNVTLSVRVALLNLSANCVRCLRNLCAGNIDHQLCIGESNLVPVVSTALRTLLTFQSGPAQSSSIWPLVRVMLQLCGNLVSSCQDNVAVVWPLLFPDVFTKAVACPDVVSVNTCVMIIHTCLVVDSSRRSYLYTDVSRGVPLLADLLLLTTREDMAEWTLLLGEQLISGSDFSSIFGALSGYPAARVVMVDMSTATLSNNPDPTVSPSTTVSFQSGNALFAETLLFLAQQCRIWSAELPESAPPPEKLSAKIQLARSVIQYIGCATGRVDGIEILKKSPEIFETILGTLRHLTPPATEATKKFVSEQEGKKSTYYGLKRDLVRCIANLLAEKHFQDKLQSEEGMVVLLNNCGVDHSNPYVGQWAILAIRNACENHPGNQSIIAALKRQGSADVSLLRKMGMDVDVSEDGTVRVKAAALPEEDPVEY